MRVLLTGGNGLVGKAIRRVAAELDCDWELDAPSRLELNLSSQAAISEWFGGRRYDAIIHAAARVGGIKANITYPTAFLAENALINTLVIEAARLHDVRNLLFVGSSCMYPKDLEKKLEETDILTAPLEPTNEGYALSKILGARHCSAIASEFGLNYRTVIPCNLYGPDDHFDLEKGHLVASALRKVSMAHSLSLPSVEIWGDGTARREFMYVDDLARFVIDWLPRLEDLPQLINVGVGHDHTVNDYYRIAAEVVGYAGSFEHDISRPAGMRRKLMDVGRSNSLGWQAKTLLDDGMRQAYLGMLQQDAQAARKV
ncbi:MAG: GDP-L-fucose synthase [Bosea sp.]|uniref:GDP-L-fucose synthase family protein n=1 Tax=unclassified Bosea (in: a-proteobacteria) TaxID=2653178 RepID=UPI00095DABA3|nr:MULTISPECIES: GDP-L-fucose synthase [unclassified Bosea (in: a-proteobacteria)]MBN9458528.1 GDP-L-fucose synthase [Bosea sp. (in: a-proteobacteria)]OJV07354.1 MAG: hypothetical protein BGO20_15305 [Bosea sp. 67-29]